MTSKPPLRSLVLASFGWAAAGSGGQFLFQLFALAILARFLSPAEFGVVSAAIIIAQLSQIFNEFGIGAAIVQREQLLDIDIRVGFTLSCLFGGIVILALWTSSSTISVLLGIPELTWVIRSYTFVFALKSFSAVAESLMHREMEFRLLARADTISFALGYAGLGIFCAFIGLSYWALVVAHLSQSAIKTGLILSCRSHSKAISLDMATVKSFLHFGLGQSLARLGSFVANQGDSFVVAKVLGVERLGEYGRANQLVVIPGNQLGAVFDKVLFPTFSTVQTEKDRFGLAYYRSLGIITMLGMPIVAVLYVVAEDLALVMLGQQWSNVVEPMEILSLSLIFRLVHKISDPTARAAGAIYERAWRQGLVAVTMVLGAYAGSEFGLIGVACGVLFATVLNAFLMVQLCSKIAGEDFNSLMMVLSPGFRLGIFTYILVLGVQYFSRLIFESHLGVLAVTVTTATIALGTLIYLFPKVSLGRIGLDLMGYAWTVLNLEKRFGLRNLTI